MIVELVVVENMSLDRSCSEDAVVVKRTNIMHIPYITNGDCDKRSYD